MHGKHHKSLRVAALLALLAFACSGNSSLVDPNDPFDDPFFREGWDGTSSLDEILREPAPSVGWLARDGFVHQQPPSDADEPYGYAAGAGHDDRATGEGGDNVLLEAESGGTTEGEDPAEIYGAYGEEDAGARRGQKSFYERASEATLATMSVLVGAGMAALPFLIGT